MSRSAISATSVFLVLFPVIGFAQQEVSPTNEPNGTGAKVRAQETPAPLQRRAVPAPRPAPAATPPALRRGIADGLPVPSATGAKAIPAPPAGSYGVVSAADGGGGIFRDTDSEAEAWLGADGYGVSAYGSTMGGYFKNSTQSAYAALGFADSGIVAVGNVLGAEFHDADGSGLSFLAYDRPTGTDKGGFANAGEYGVYASGNFAGGYFQDGDDSGYAYIGNGDYGIRAYGNVFGGLFQDRGESGYAYVGNGHYGIRAYGNTMGGYFKDNNNTGYANVGEGDYGIRAYGNTAGGYFEDTDEIGYVFLGYLGDGIRGFGESAGGYFADTNSSAYASVAEGSYKIFGNGSVDFVQNHPYDRDAVIVYAAPEGDEVATYTRGMARLIDGEALVPLGETFKWVTNPDIGLTAFLTPVSDWCDLYIAEQATDSILVRSRDGSDCSFNFMVYGLRIGFEESSVVQEKVQEAYIPSMTDHRELYRRRPDLRAYNSLERFKGMRTAVGMTVDVDLSRAHVLRDAIVEFDPARDELPRRPQFPKMAEGGFPGRDEGDKVEAQPLDAVGTSASDCEERPGTPFPVFGGEMPVDADGNVYATSFRPSSREVASLVDVSETVAPGDVLVIDRDNPGVMRRNSEGHDTGVIGVVAAEAGVMLGTQPPVSDEGTPETTHQAAVALAGVVSCKVDADYGAIWPGDLLVTSPTPGHAMRTDAPLPGTMLGKALEPLEEGVGTIRVLVMLR